MADLLYIEASPRDQRSYSVRAGRAFLDAYRHARPDAQVETLNLFTTDLPPFDGDTIAAKYAILHNQDFTPAQRGAWTAVEALIDQFRNAQSYVIACGMWNYSIPYRLKQYIDLIVQPGYTFKYEPGTGYVGLVPDRRVCLILARGGSYPPGGDTFGLDHQQPYLQLILGFMGLTRIEPILIEPTLERGPDVAGELLEAALATARTFAASFAQPDSSPRKSPSQDKTS